MSVALRYLAGGNPYDLMISHGISYSCVYESIWSVVDAVNICEELAFSFPSDHLDQRQLAQSFKGRSQVGLTSCVAAIDGILIWTTKP